MTFSDLLRVPPGTTPDLAEIDPGATPGFDGDKAGARERLKELRDELGDFQERLWAESRQSLLVVLQALDAGGKDGLIRKVISAFNPQGTRVSSFGVPTEEELRHDFLWRIHANTPGRGRIGVFNRSHYEDVLVVRVKELVPQAVWEPRYDHINAFEAHLAASDPRRPQVVSRPGGGGDPGRCGPRDGSAMAEARRGSVGRRHPRLRTTG